QSQPAPPPPPQKPPEECFKGLDELSLPPRIPMGEEVYGEGLRPGTDFRLKTSLLIHQKTHAVGKSDSPFVCSECGCGFSHQAQLTRHQTIHADRPHQCSECHKAFNRKSSLVVHQKTHCERPRPFQCPQCNKTFIRKQHLDDHTRTHTGEKPYQCPECEKRFAEKSKLTNHYRIHTGERPYRCGQCDKRFVRAHHLVKHQSSVHQAGRQLPKDTPCAALHCESWPNRAGDEESRLKCGVHLPFWLHYLV
uniref:C2H2-type domain-containing protein n=1 Tax=Laticauda laticaudata TaxID=8630 RepID=A0A8C5RSY9_LATLA